MACNDNWALEILFHHGRLIALQDRSAVTDAQHAPLE